MAATHVERATSIVLNESHLRRIISRHLDYDHLVRCHRSLEGNSPVPRSIEPPEQGRIVAMSAACIIAIQVAA
jgi:hypothetical protein